MPQDPNPSRRRWLRSASSLIAVTAASGWGTALAQNTANTAQGARVLRIGYQKGWLSVLKNRGTLEQRLAPLGASVSWAEFSAGPVQLEALNVGSIDFGNVGEAPPIFAQAAGAPLVYASAGNPNFKAEAVVVPAGSPIRSVADLKGKRIAYNKGSNVHYFLVKLLEKHGLQYGDVQSVFLPPADARAAFEKGSVDAWVIWDPFLAAAEKTLGARVLANGEGVVKNRQYYFSSREFATRHLDLLRIAIDEVNQIERWASKNPRAAAQELSRILGLDPAVTELYVGRMAYGTTPITSDILAEQQAIADTFHQLKLIPKPLNLRHAAPVDLR